MKKITAQELRNKWIEFFKTKNHTIIPSASLVPENDPSVLFTMAGMFPLVPYLMGQEHPGGNRVANIQKCIRTIDIDEVGDNTHLTFFEMMGNWSFGDYFKKEAIEWSFEFLTDEKWLGIPLDRLAFSVFAGDDDAPFDEESYNHWLRLGVPAERIAKLPKEDNWWIAGETGPCGPDTEMFFWIDDGTPAPANFQETASDKRWVEIWNDVFMEFEKKSDGSLVPLENKNVDTGMGLDRVVAVLNGHKSVYDTELFTGMFDVIGLSQDILSGDEVRKARIIVDHIRASVFIAGDGVEPSNKERGYILRRLLRRAMVYAKLLNLQENWLKALVGKVMEEYNEAYPELVVNSAKIFSVIEGEQDKFGKTLEKGLKEFSKLFERRMHHPGDSVATPPQQGGENSPPFQGGVPTEGRGGGLTGTDAFNLYQTYGFPLELTEELAESSGQEVNREEFSSEFKKHQDLSRTASAGTFKGGLADHSDIVVRYHTATHLLHKALRDILGEEVWQKGSNITAERTRFDFTYPQKMTDEQKQQVEDLVNKWIEADAEMKQEMMPLEKAKELGAIGLFGEKYADTVSIYTATDKDGNVISREFCGGPHVEHTGVIGKFRIAKEEAVSAGVRRIKAVIE
ncbi:TPA: alanine--tRNA ligase [Patescibacteria group bacterium]|jgi:alanyl-tRNA synthetase|nr:alanine--tRNA ligase [Patescibacteria group bacterium]